MSSIAIIGGTGALGGALAARFAAMGREVWIGSRDPAKAAGAAAGLTGATGTGLAEAAAQAELCILTVPYAAHGETLRQIREAVQGKILIDATAPLKPPKVGTVQLPAAGCAAVEAAQILGLGVRVVSALQTIGAEKLALGGEIDADVLVTGDDAEAVETVRALLAELGLRSWHAGPLANSAAAEAMTSVLIQLNRRYKLAQSGVRITGRPKDAPAPAAALSIKAVRGLCPLPVIAQMTIEEDGNSLYGTAPEVFTRRLDEWSADVVGINCSVGPQVMLECLERMVKLTSRPVSAQPNAGRPRSVDGRNLYLCSPEYMASYARKFVQANAGIDASNVPGGVDGEAVVLWPLDPDASARGLRAALEAHFRVRLAVVISDSVGRAWRMGTTGSAIGVAGLKPLRDRRGESDLFGRELKATVVGVADEIAAAASLVIGEAAEGTPVAIVRGATYDPDPSDVGVGELLRPLDKDLFR